MEYTLTELHIKLLKEHIEFAVDSYFKIITIASCKGAPDKPADNSEYPPLRLVK
jgi:hypothetical protein